MFRPFPRLLFLVCAVAFSVGIAPHARAARNSVVDVAGMLPPLRFQMMDAASGKPVSAKDFRGKVVMLYFGYTNCPDVCPDTLYKVHQIFKRLGPDASRVVLLFATVDPYRDSLAILKKYLALFDPHIQGLRGNPNQLYSLARRYRVVFSVHRSADPKKYSVVHSSSIYVFDPDGNARYLIADLGLAQHPDYDLIVDDLKKLAQDPPAPSFFTWLAARG